MSQRSEVTTQLTQTPQGSQEDPAVEDRLEKKETQIKQKLGEIGRGRGKGEGNVAGRERSRFSLLWTHASWQPHKEQCISPLHVTGRQEVQSHRSTADSGARAHVFALQHDCPAPAITSAF